MLDFASILCGMCFEHCIAFYLRMVMCFMLGYELLILLFYAFVTHYDWISIVVDGSACYIVDYFFDLSFDSSGSRIASV